MKLIIALGVRAVSVLAGLFFVLSFVFSPAIANERHKNQQDTSTEVVYRLYKDFAWQAVLLSPNAPPKVFVPIESQPRPVLERYFHAELSSLLISDNRCRLAKGLCNLDFDPIFASQDPGAFDLNVQLLVSGNVAVQFTYPGNGQKIRLEYKVKPSAKGWRITDIIYTSNGGSSLKQILQQNAGGKPNSKK
jgi:hypothetical protein